MKTFIVVQLACYRKPSLLIKDVKAEFGVDLDRRHLHHYDPERGGRRSRIGREWRDLFRTTREKFFEGKISVGIAQQTYRLQLLQRAADRAEESGNIQRACEIAEQAAKETGGAYTNRRELTGKGGGPVETVGLTMDQWKAEAQKSLSQVAETMAAFGEGADA